MNKLANKIIILTIVLTLALSTSFINLVLAQAVPPAPPTPPTAPEAPVNDSQPPVPPTAPEAPQAPTPPNQLNENNNNNIEEPNYDSESGNSVVQEENEHPGVVARNSGNGANSTNSSNAETENNTTLDADNLARVINSVTLEAITGDNNASRNTGGASIVDTGNASISTLFSTAVNTTSVSGVGCNTCGNGASAINKNNGANSDNSATAGSTTDTTVDIDNDAYIDTQLTGLALTGSNDASRNVGDSIILTGDSNLATTIITDANTTAFGVYNFDVVGNQTGDIVLGENPANCINCGESGGVGAINLGNGSDSTNSANSQSTNNFTETITNDGDVVNNINLVADSGNNTADRNTGGDSTIQTGDANVVANVINTLNTTIPGGLIYSVNIYGDLIGNIVLPNTSASSSCNNCCASGATAVNSQNGADSNNTANASVDNSTTVNQTNNANIDNNLSLAGNTGNNQTNFNTSGSNLVDTGEVNISANTANVANLNVASSSCTDEPIYILVINQIGQWLGQIIGLPSGSLVYGDDGSAYYVDGNGYLVAVNSGNGSGSTNTANASSTNTTDINQTNNATIQNNINIEANTGDNSASRNTGGDSSITTGDANIIVNIINFVNSNFSGRKVILTVVNVLGSFFGNILGPNHQASSQNNNNQSQNNNSNNANSSNSNTNSTNISNGQEEEQGQVLVATSIKSARFTNQTGLGDDSQNVEEISPTAGSPEDIITATGGFNWKWLLLAIPTIVIAALILRKRLAGLKIFK